MSGDLVYIPSPTDSGYVELTKTPTGRLLRKQILPMDDYFVHPKDKNIKIFVNEKMAQSLVANFNKNLIPVQVPIVNDQNEHIEDPLRNAGEVIDVDYDEHGVYATIDARKYADAFGETILGASAFMNLDYTDQKGNHLGPTLLHVAGTNRPYINSLDGFKEIIKASADISDEQPILLMREGDAEENIPLSESDKEDPMTVEEMIEALKAEGIDVPALQEKAAEHTELSAQLADVNAQLALSGSSDTVEVSDLAEAIVELSGSNKSLSAKVETLEAANADYAQKQAEAEVDGFIKAGRILPKQRTAMVKLSMTDREAFDELLPETSLLSLSEKGVTLHEAASRSEELVAAVTDYAARARAQQSSTKKTD